MPPCRLGYPSARSSASEDEQADEVQCPISLNTANGDAPDFELRSPKTTILLLKVYLHHFVSIQQV